MNFVGPIADIINRLWDCTATGTKYIRKLKENLISLRSTKDDLSNLRNDLKRRIKIAEDQQMSPRDQVKGWINKVDAMEGEVDVIIQEASQLISQRCLGGCCPNYNYLSRYKVGKKITKKLTIMAELRSEGNFNEVADPRPLAVVEVIPSRPTVGMDSMLENVWKYIIEEDQVGIIGVHGMEGIGKTTLLMKINNEFHLRVTHDFDVVIWVEVSKESNLRRVQKDIAKRLGLKPEDEIQDTALARLIFNALSKKKFVLLLDDVWDRVDFEDVGVPRPDSNNKCKVVFTTRFEDVCRLMEAQKNLEVECLGWSEAWDLFQQTIGKVLELAARVALECDGIPLALISIGRTMVHKKSLHGWNHAIKLLRKYASVGTSCLEEPISVGPWGGRGGSHWTHNVKGGIIQIKIVYEWGIDSIIFRTRDNDGVKKYSDKFGSDGGSRTETIDINWPEEYLTSINGTYGRYNPNHGPVIITSLCFTTNLAMHGPLGSGFGTSFSLPMEGGVIVGFHGKCGLQLDAIGVYVKPLNCLSIEDSNDGKEGSQVEKFRMTVFSQESRKYTSIEETLRDIQSKLSTIE